MKISIKELIVVHVCYRDVFSAPVSVSDLKKWMDVINKGHEEIFDRALNELKNDGRIIVKEGYLALSDREALIEIQEEKSHFTNHLIAKHTPLLTILGKLPFIRFIGISGSLAADNPTPEKRAGYNHGTVDIDLFMITSRNSLWLFVLLERCYTNLRRVFMGHHLFCFNYITDESFLEVYNRNFYTATEIINVKPVVNKGVYQEFLIKNHWFKNYYFNNQIGGSKEKDREGKTYISYLLWLPNFISFSLFCVFRAIKRWDLSVLKEIKLTFDPINKCNLLRISNPKGGYQEMIKTRFERCLKGQFTDYHTSKLMQFLFPKESLFEYDKLDVYDIENAEIFEKY